MLSVIGDITVADQQSRARSARRAEEARGVLIDRTDPASIHALFCRGVGQFMVQGWYDDPNERRWIPQVNPDEDGELDDDSDFL